jgi:hypothetical protein
MISAQIRAQVRQRAQNACEYCHLHQDDSPLAALDEMAMAKSLC